MELPRAIRQTLHAFLKAVLWVVVVALPVLYVVILGFCVLLTLDATSQVDSNEAKQLWVYVICKGLAFLFLVTILMWLLVKLLKKAPEKAND